jgi:hypothetical protein
MQGTVRTLYPPQSMRTRIRYVSGWKPLFRAFRAPGERQAACSTVYSPAMWNDAFHITLICALSGQLKGSLEVWNLCVVEIPLRRERTKNRYYYNIMCNDYTFRTSLSAPCAIYTARTLYVPGAGLPALAGDSTPLEAGRTRTAYWAGGF